MKRTCTRICRLLPLAALTLRAQPADPAGEPPVFEMDAVTVYHSQTDFAPVFAGPMPRFSYAEAPLLPRGDLILALEFFDQYRDTAVPGRIKWCGLLHFPVVDGYEGTHLKWICLYLYDDRMFAFDPTARRAYERRFAVPIPPEQRNRPEVLYRFAESYVERVFPGSDDEFYQEEYFDLGDGEGGGEGSYETIHIEPGRIAPVLISHRGQKPEELVRLAMQHEEDPNPDRGTGAEMGPAPETAKGGYSWAKFLEDIGPAPDAIALAAELVKPRWSQVTRFHYVKDRLLLGDKEMSTRVLLFNIGMRLFAYTPKYGVWRTDAVLGDIEDLKGLAARLKYPGVQTIERVEFIAEGPLP